MTSRTLNRELLEGNTCFGCGHENHRGLRIEVVQDGETPSRLLGSFEPTEEMAGFPGVIHGGAIFTALDCLATWVATMSGGQAGKIWLLRSAETTYHRPGSTSDKLALSGEIVERAGNGSSLVVHAEARNSAGDLVVSAELREVSVTVDRFLKITGQAELPDNWAAFLRSAR